MENVKRWYFGSFGGEVKALNNLDDTEVDEEAAVKFVLATDFDKLRELLLNTKGWLSKGSEVYRQIDKIEPLAGGWEYWPDGGPGLGDFSPVDVRFRNGTEAHGCVVGAGSASLNRFYWPRTPQDDPGMDIVAIRRLPKSREGVCLDAGILGGGYQARSLYRVQPQGEPVGDVIPGDMPAQSGYTKTVNPVSEGKYTFPLYAEQPAPVAEVKP